MPCFLAVSFLTVYTLTFPAEAGEAGKEIFVKYKCITSHTVSAYGIGIVKGEEIMADDPPDLSDVGTRRDEKFLSKYLRKKTRIDGRKHKKRFRGSKEEYKELLIWLSGLTKPPIK